MRLDKLIYSIRERIRESHDDSTISDREIIFELDIQRAIYYSNEYNKNNRPINDQVAQPVCLTLAESTLDECGCTPTNYCTVLRSTTKLPTALDLHNRDAIISVKSTQIGTVPFNHVRYSRFPHVGLEDWDRNHIFTTYHPNGYVYVKCKNSLAKLLTRLTVIMVLESPTDIKDYLDCPDGTSSCWDLMSFNYPIKAKAFGYVKETVANNFIQKLAKPEDKENDAEDSVQIRTK